MPRRSASRACAFTQSSTVTTGKDEPYGLPVEAAADVVDPNDEEFFRVDRLTGPDHVVPPADVVRVLRVVARHVMGGVEGVAGEHGVRFRRVERPVGLVDEIVRIEHRAALEAQRLGEMQRLRPHGPDRARFYVVSRRHKKTRFSLSLISG